jgi:hypothetical protein
VSVSFIIIIQFKENTMLKQVLATTLFVGALVAATDVKETPKDAAPTPAVEAPAKDAKHDKKDAKHEDAKHKDAKHDKKDAKHEDAKQEKKGHEAKTPDAGAAVTPAPAAEAPAKEVK